MEYGEFASGVGPVHGLSRVMLVASLPATVPPTLPAMTRRPFHWSVAQLWVGSNSFVSVYVVPLPPEASAPAASSGCGDAGAVWVSASSSATLCLVGS